MATLAQTFLDLLKESDCPVKDSEIRLHFKAEYAHLPKVINELTKQGRVKLFHQGNDLVYGFVSPEEAEKVRGLSGEHKMVLQEVERAGNMGIWTRDLKNKTSLPQPVVTKVLRLLETRKLVKSVKSISSKNKKLYMLFDTVPSREITGGPWYNEQEFDHVFIEALSKFVLEVIRAGGMVTLSTVTDRVKASGISKVALGSEEVLSIVKTLMYDGCVEEVRAAGRVVSNSGRVETRYKVSSPVTTLNALTDVPCGSCPVFDKCQEGNIISPQTCVYLTQWLHLKDVEF